MISSPDIGHSILEHVWEGNMEPVPLVTRCASFNIGYHADSGEMGSGNKPFSHEVPETIRNGMQNYRDVFCRDEGFDHEHRAVVAPDHHGQSRGEYWAITVKVGCIDYLSASNKLHRVWQCWQNDRQRFPYRFWATG